MSRGSGADEAGGGAGGGAAWLYLQVDLAGLDAVPGLLRTVVQPGVADCPAVRDWFHLQYVDATGPALRLRLLAPVATHDAVRVLLTDRLHAASGVSAVRERVYAPETAKFGDGPALDRHHEIFCRGTEAALAVPADHIGTLGLAAAAQLALTDELGPERSRTFLHHYAWYWSGRGRLGPRWRETVAQLDARPQDPARVRELARSVLAARGTGGPLRVFAARYRSLAPSAARASAHPPAFVLHTHLHLFANRLGVLPAQEAHVARLLARS